MGRNNSKKVWYECVDCKAKIPAITLDFGVHGKARIGRDIKKCFACGGALIRRSERIPHSKLSPRNYQTSVPKPTRLEIPKQQLETIREQMK